MRLIIITVFLFVGFNFHVLANELDCEQKRCGVHEHWNDCGIYWYCERTCAEPEGRPCPKICVPGCFCDTDFIRQKANGTCIREGDCKKRRC